MGSKSPCCGKRDPKDKPGVVKETATLTGGATGKTKETKAGTTPGATPGAPKPNATSTKKMETVRNSIENLMKIGKNSL